MSSGVKSVLKTAAMIAVPFVAAVAAPILAPVAAFGALGTGLAGAAIGAGLGAGVGALTGRGAGTGALIGGLGGGLGAGISGATGGLGGLLPGFGTAGTTGTTGIAGLGGFGSATTPLTYAGAAAPTALPGAGLATTGVTASGGLLSSLAGGITVPGLANLAMTLYNKPESELTDAERQAVIETAQLATTNKELFDKRVADAQMLRNMASPNPEQAFATVKGAAERAGLEAQRENIARFGGSGAGARVGAAARSAAIRGTAAGATAAAQETAQGFERLKSAMALTPTEMPTSTQAGLMTLPLYQQKAKQQEEWTRDVARAAGGLGGSARTNAGLFGSIYG